MSLMSRPSFSQDFQTPICGQAGGKMCSVTGHDTIPKAYASTSPAIHFSDWACGHTGSAVPVDGVPYGRTIPADAVPENPVRAEQGRRKEISA
ncbi:uncharacterized protein LOC116841706 isoform X2 [Odontomachus brunneus]|uniref:uncharacterized protein LOC116841706 isoform X2 n=1 Tax=Odontomachus brunneus TaxID=486640 RepID=UPI0013F26F4C|nr:uncharacterized protein LOC116841706 isoform X2 [Odontomachus brunneus]